MATSTVAVFGPELCNVVIGILIGIPIGVESVALCVGKVIAPFRDRHRILGADACWIVQDREQGTTTCNIISWGGIATTDQLVITKTRCAKQGTVHIIERLTQETFARNMRIVIREIWAITIEPAKVGSCAVDCPSGPILVPDRGNIAQVVCRVRPCHSNTEWPNHWSPWVVSIAQAFYVPALASSLAAEVVVDVVGHLAIAGRQVRSSVFMIKC